MNKKLIINIIASLTSLIGICLFFVALVGKIMGDSAYVIYIFSATALVVFILGTLVFIKTRQKDIKINFKDGFAIVAFGWIFMTIFGSIPFYFILPEFTYADAFFEMMSGFTTTGASVIKDVEKLPYAINFWRHLSNWLGGMGVIVLSLAILPILGIGGMQLYKAEVPSSTSDQLTSRIANTAKILWVIYFLLTALLFIILYFLGMNFFDSLCHTFSTMATGGFSTKNASIGHFSPTIQYVITFFMILAGINFVLHIRIFQGRFKSYFCNEECRFYFLIIFVITSLITLYLYQQSDYSFEHAFRSALFQVVSILTTTGFANDNYATWGTLAIGLILILYFIGGSGGSTSGGIKVIRILHLFKNTKEELKCATSPHYLSNIKIDGVRVSKTTIKQVSNFFFLYILLFFIVGFIMCTVKGIDINTAFSSSIACLGNVGPGIGKVNQASNYAFLPSYAKMVLSLAMLIGRLEIYTIIVLFLPYFWKNN